MAAGILAAGKALLGTLEAGKALGSGMGSPIGAVVGIGQLIAGRRAEKKADDLLPPSENVMERQMLNTIRRRRRGLETGTAFNAQQNAANRLASNYMQNAFKAGGQANPAVLSQLMAQSAENIAAQSGQQLGQTLGMEQEQTSKMADVSRDLSLLRSARKSAKGARLQSDGTSNLLASLGGTPKKTEEKKDNQSA